MKDRPIQFNYLRKQLEKISLLPNEGGYNLHTDTGAYSPPYYSISAAISGVLNCLLSGNLIDEVQGLRGTTFVDQVMGDVYDNDYENKVSILLGGVDLEIADGFQTFLMTKAIKRALGNRVTVPQWSYRIPIKIPFTYIEQRTGQ